MTVFLSCGFIAPYSSAIECNYAKAYLVFERGNVRVVNGVFWDSDSAK